MPYLGGGGSEDDESLLWDLVFQPPQRVAVWPYAMPPSKIPDTMRWIKRALSKRGDFEVEIGETAPDFGLARADVLAIPGGNTFDLLAWVQQNDLEQSVKDFLARGGKVYGGSAGAILLGADIAICDVETGGLDVNKIGLKDTRSLNLLSGAVVFPHYDPVDAAYVFTCQKWADENHVVVVAIPEKSGVAVDGETGYLNTGPEDVVLFKPQQEPVACGAGHRFLL
ncbi:class I glutamine amidotransferase-like protein [Truncatella angustata]|uniref:Class I glutamine amidotransferase-like protein n=1 Tax=Truncatella angustata TaxID=152316 RepID=A0A9P8RQD0_9PEZI|nr:class I glutamine amidotransferase-like protein [Truncatella angustata]KAH6647867.1 class I glutamine amidotransferase-like protein [Truncatella angustata]KAH8200349.1 hypothetical protein TruAng_005502 [Truncatella angustata]